MMEAVQSEPIDNEQVRRLQRWNIATGLIHAAQATILLVIASRRFAAGLRELDQRSARRGRSDPGRPAVRASLRSRGCGLPLPRRRRSPVRQLRPPRGWYERNLDRSVNYARWIEYSLSASLMVALIAMLSGVWS